MRLVHLSDLHLGFRQYQRLTPAGINQREADVGNTASRAIDRIIELKPDAVVIGGDVFHSVRPSNSAILHAYRLFSRLRNALPDAAIVMVAGNHDAPRTSDAGCILRLFREIGIAVADSKAELFTFPHLSLAVLAVPYMRSAERPLLIPPGGFQNTVLLMHGGTENTLPNYVSELERAEMEIRVNDLHSEQWSYVALGHYHVYREVAPRAYYSGSIDYTSSNPWGEKHEERDRHVPGKGFIEQNLTTGEHKFHLLNRSRSLIELEPIEARGLTAKELDEVIAGRLNNTSVAADDQVVRLLIKDVPRHVVRELDQNALRDFRKKALHFQIDTRKPEVIAVRTAGGAPGRRATLEELVAERLRDRVLPAGIEREALVTLGLRYLAEAEESVGAALPVSEG